MAAVKRSPQLILGWSTGRASAYATTVTVIFVNIFLTALLNPKHHPKLLEGEFEFSPRARRVEKQAK